MPLSQFTAVPFIAERSEATPGLWNNIFSVISQNVDQLRSDLSQFAGLSSVGTAQVIGGFSGNTLRAESGSSLNVLPFSTQFIANSIDSGGAIFNVKAFGAIGNGTTDDSGSIRAAVSALSFAGGGVLYFPHGNYAVASTISIDVGGSTSTWGRVSVVGESRGGSVLVPSVSPVFTVGNGTGSIDGFQMRDLQYSLSTDVWWDHGLVRLRFMRDLVLENILLIGGPAGSENSYAGYLFELDTSYNGVIRNCEAYGRYTYLGELNSVSVPSQQQDSVRMERNLAVSSLGYVVRETGGNYHNLTWQNFKHALVHAQDTDRDDETLINVPATAGTSSLSLAATSSMSTGYPISIGTGATFEYNRILSKNASSISLAHPLRFSQASGTSLIHGGIGVSTGFAYNLIFNDPHFEKGAIGILAADTRQLTISQPYVSSMEVVRIAGGAVQDLHLYGGTYGGSGTSNFGIRVLGSGDTTNLARLSLIGPFTTVTGATSTFTPYTNDSDVSSDRQRRIINHQTSTGIMYDEWRIQNASNSTYARVIIGGNTILEAHEATGTLTGRHYYAQKLSIGSYPPVNTFDITGGMSWTSQALSPIGTALLPGYAITSEASLGLFRSGISTLALSYGTLNLATQAVRLSMRTLAASAVTVSAAKTNVAVDEVVFTIGGASGASLCVMSGGTLYFFNSAGSAAQS